MAEEKLLNADGSDFEENDDAFVLDDLDDTEYTALRNRSHLIAKNE